MPKGIYKHKKLTLEHRYNLSCSRKGKYGGEKHPMYGKHHSEGTKFQISKTKKGTKLTKKHKENIGKGIKGKEHSTETKQKMSITHSGKKLSELTKTKLRAIGLKRIGSMAGGWKGGLTSINRCLRRSSAFIRWRKSVFKRDNFTCQNLNCPFCNNKRGVTIHPHHIKEFSKYPKLRFKIDNGITYCDKFHLKSGIHKT